MTVAASFSPATFTQRTASTITITGLTASTNYMVLVGDPNGTFADVGPHPYPSDGSGQIVISNYVPTAAGAGYVAVYNAVPTATFGPTTATVVDQL